MKVKFLLILLSVLFVVPICASKLKESKRRPRIKWHSNIEKGSARSPLVFDLNVQEANNCLQINFQGSLPDAEVTVTDKNGNTVVYEPQTFINEGEMIYIYTPNAYPYTIEITSPVMDVTGEITQEEI